MNKDESVSSFLTKLETELAATEEKLAALQKTRDDQFATVGVMRRALGMEPLKGEPKTNQIAQPVIGLQQNFDIANKKPYLGMNLLSAVKLYLEKVQEPKSSIEIAEALTAGGVYSRSNAFPAVVRATLAQSGSKIGVESFGHGIWGLSQWRPGGSKGE